MTSGRNGAEENKPSFLLDTGGLFTSSSDTSATIFPTWILHPKLESYCNSFWNIRNMSNWIWVPFVEGFHEVCTIYRLVQSCCLSLPVHWLNPPSCTKGKKSQSSLASGLGREKIIPLLHNKILALRPTPLQSEPIRLWPTWWLNRA